MKSSMPMECVSCRAAVYFSEDPLHPVRKVADDKDHTVCLDEPNLKLLLAGKFAINQDSNDKKKRKTSATTSAAASTADTTIKYIASTPEEDSEDGRTLASLEEALLDKFHVEDDMPDRRVERVVLVPYILRQMPISDGETKSEEHRLNLDADDRFFAILEDGAYKSCNDVCYENK